MFLTLGLLLYTKEILKCNLVFQNFENPEAPDPPTAFTSRRPRVNMVIPLLSYSQIWVAIETLHYINVVYQ